MTPLQSIVAAGTKLWLDSVDPDEIARNRAFGATGATSNPIIISDLLNTGRFDADIAKFFAAGHADEAVAWAMTDKLVKDAQLVFEPTWHETKGNDGWVSFELDPLLEDLANTMSVADKSQRYVELGKHYFQDARNRHHPKVGSCHQLKLFLMVFFLRRKLFLRSFSETHHRHPRGTF